MAICGRVFAPLSRFGVAARTAMRALRRVRFSALASLLDCGWRLRVIYGGRSLQRLTSAHPQEKEKARSDERA